MRTTNGRAWAAIAGVVPIAAGALPAMGRSPLCPCGTVRLWAGAVRSAENSQQVLDWYSLGHLVHGLLLLYAAIRVALRGRPAAVRLMVAVVVEAGWEVPENSPLDVDRHRAVTLAVGYGGDSVLDSVSDIDCMMPGSALAGRLPVWCAGALG